MSWSDDGVAPAGVSLGFWQDCDPLEALVTARLADELGYGQIWIGEMATFDAFALAVAVGTGAGRAELVVGPLAPAVRDPAGIAMGVASVAATTGRAVHVALGASSPVVVEHWHGRAYGRPADTLRKAARALRPLLAGERVAGGGYRLRLPPVLAEITIAAFGPVSVRVAAEEADRMVINLCSATQAARLRERLDMCARRAGRQRPRLAAWVPAAVDPTTETIAQLRRGVVGYLAAPGYAEMFAREGFAELVDRASRGAHPRDLLAEVPVELLDTVCLLGDRAACLRRMAAYAQAGVDEVVVVPATAGDDGGARTLGNLRPGQG